jgi:homoserine O-acetyltransferase
MGDGRRYHALPSLFAMKRGGQLYGARVAYETWGTLNAESSNALLIFTGLSTSAHAASGDADPSDGWWEAMIGPGHAIDTSRYFVICVNSLGSDKGSTSPASIDAATGEPYRLTFPELSLEDVANAAHSLIHWLRIETLDCLVGCSMGGMSALAYLALHPGGTRRHISINTAPQALPFAIAIRSLQREAVRTDPNWNHGHYDRTRYPTQGMSIARKLGMITYRSAGEWNGRFARNRLNRKDRAGKQFGIEFQVESYLEGNARRFIHTFDPNSFLYLSRATDWFDIAEHGGTVERGLARLTVEEALVVGTTSDILFPLHQQEQIATGLREGGSTVEFVALDSPQGHDAFLVDIETYSRTVGSFLSR